MNILIYWFRNDLRLDDNPAFAHACRTGVQLLPVFCHDPASDQLTPWGFVRSARHRRDFLNDTLDDLSRQLAARGSCLLQLYGQAQELLPQLARAIEATGLVCEAIAAPQEQAEIAALRAAGMTLELFWQSTLLNPADLPFTFERLPDMFTAFRQAVEKAGVTGRAPEEPPASVPPLPLLPKLMASLQDARQRPPAPASASTLLRPPPDQRSSFPYQNSAFGGGESAARRHLDRYFSSKLPLSYKTTRNGLSGIDYSSKFSPWLASGALSPRRTYAALKHFEAEHGANDSTYWLWFELLWRDYFRFLHLKYGRKLYRAQGLGLTTAQDTESRPARSHDEAAFGRWCAGTTGEPLVDAGMKDLQATGYLSNRLRQIVASYLIHDLGCDWRAGAAWFESQLLDYDVYSNQGNWLYLAGCGTDPRSGRRFNPQKQARDYDPAGHYQMLWNQGNSGKP